MGTATTDVMNALRSAAFAKDGRQAFLDGLEELESLIQSFEGQAAADHAMLADTMAKYEYAEHELKVSEGKRYVLEEELRLMKARLFGKTSEKWKPDETLQAVLFNEIEMAIQEKGEKEEQSRAPTPRRRKPRASDEGHGGRSPLPESLPRREKIIDIAQEKKICEACGKPLAKIGEAISERLCMEPIRFYVERTIRPEYGCSCGSGGVQAAPAPEHIIPKSVASPTVLAQIITSKFCDALPFYRQSNILARQGIDISRTTMARWAEETHRLVAPISELIRKLIKESPVMNMDETRVRVLHENGTKKEGLSWMWVAGASIEREAERREVKLLTYSYAPGRDKEVAEELLSGFSGVLMTDAYASYNEPSRGAGIVQAACMAHARRKFADVLKIEKGNEKAQVAMGFFSALYAVERECAERPPDKRLAARQEKSRPIMDAFSKWLVAEAPHVLPQSTLGKAINYTIPLWPRLSVFLSDGRVPIDNNLAERAIRPFAVGRRNWLFFDQSTGAEASTTFYTIIETAKANDVEPMHYLQFLFSAVEHFGAQHMPWEKLLPIPAIRAHAESLGIPYPL